MATELEDLKIFRDAEDISDQVWEAVKGWDRFARDALGIQLIRAVDSIGSNIAEAYGRYHFGEKIRFLYYARGSLYEAKYWIRRARRRNLISETRTLQFTQELSHFLLGR